MGCLKLLSESRGGFGLAGNDSWNDSLRGVGVFFSRVAV